MTKKPVKTKPAVEPEVLDDILVDTTLEEAPGAKPEEKVETQTKTKASNKPKKDKIIAAYEAIVKRHGLYDNTIAKNLESRGFDPNEIFEIRDRILRGEEY